MQGPRQERSCQPGEQSEDREGHERPGRGREELPTCARRRCEPLGVIPRPGMNGCMAFRGEDHEAHRGDEGGEKTMNESVSGCAT